MAGKSPNLRSCALYIYSSGQPLFTSSEAGIPLVYNAHILSEKDHYKSVVAADLGPGMTTLLYMYEQNGGKRVRSAFHGLHPHGEVAPTQQSRHVFRQYCYIYHPPLRHSWHLCTLHVWLICKVACTHKHV